MTVLYSMSHGFLCCWHLYYVRSRTSVDTLTVVTDNVNLPLSWLSMAFDSIMTEMISLRTLAFLAGPWCGIKISVV